MKKVFLVVAFFTSFGVVNAQYLNRQPIGSVNTENYTLGSYGTTTGLRFINSFADTAAANNFATVNIKAIAGIVIRVVSDLWIRDNTATVWLKLASGTISTNYWGISGNTGLSGTNNFIGNTDAVNFHIRTNNLRRFTVNANGAYGLGTGEDYGTSGYSLITNGSGSAPTWASRVSGNGTIYNLSKWSSATGLTDASYIMDLNQVPQSGIVTVQDSVIFFGDSYTASSKWTTPLCTYLNAIQDNHGASGMTIEKRVPLNPVGPNMIDSLATVPVKTFKKKLLVIALGLNDFGVNFPNYNPTNYATDYDSVLTYITQTKGWNVKNILLVAPYWIGTAGYNQYAGVTGNAPPTRANQLLFVATLRQIALKWGTLSFDMYNDILRNDTTLIDGSSPIHASDSGYLFIARDIAKYLGASLNIGNITGNGTINRMAYWDSPTSITSSANNTFNGTTQAIAGATTNSTFRVGTMEHQSYALGNSWISDNIYFDGANFVSRATGAGTLFYFFGDEGQFRTAPSTTAGTGLNSYMSNSQFKTFYTNRTVAIGGDISVTAGSVSGATLVASTAGVSITGSTTLATGTTTLSPLKFTNGAPTTSLSAGNLMFNTGLLILDSTASHRDTLATRNFLRNNYQSPITNPVTGSGTLNYVPKWTPNGTTLGNSQIYDNGTNVGIGTASPKGLLDLAGATATQWVGISSTTMPDANTLPRLIVGDVVNASAPGYLYLAANESVTSFNLGGMAFANYANVGAEKRVAILVGGLDGAINSGRLGLYTSNAGSLAERWTVKAAGHLIAATDNTYDIGASSTTFRPRDLFLGRNATVGGTLGVTGVINASAGINFPLGSGTNRDLKVYNTNSGVDNLAAVGFYPSSGTNVGTAFQFIPKGTGYDATRKAQMSFFNTDFIADATNFEVMVVKSGGTDGYSFGSVKAGTGVVRPIYLDATGTASQATANLLLNIDGSTTTKAITASGLITGNAGVTTTTAVASTSVTSPLDIGGTTTTSSKTYKTTTGVGTTGADHIFQVGNNGGTEAMRILNSGNVGIGRADPPNQLSIGSNTSSAAATGLMINNASSIGYANFTLRNNSESAQMVMYGTGAATPSLYLFYQPNTNGFAFSEKVSIGTSAAAVTSAQLEVASTTKGFLPPRQTTAQRTAISSPAEGLCVYDTDLHKLYVYDGTTWQACW